MNEEKDNEFVRQVVHTHTWWRLKSFLEEQLMGANYEGEKEQEWSTDV